MEIKDYVAIASFILTLITLVVASLRASKDEMRRYADRLTVVESKIAAMPSKDNMHKLELDLSELKGSVRVMEETIKPLVVGINRIEDFIENIKFAQPVATKVTKK